MQGDWFDRQFPERLEALEGARIAVTGASGFVGGRLVRALVAAGADVVGFGRRADGSLPEGARYVRWDLVAGPLDDAPLVDAVVHCAGTVTDWGPRETFERCHVDGTRHLLASFPEPTPIVHVSTTSVYDPFREKRNVGEDAPPPATYLNAYAETKAEAERIVQTRSRATVLRPHAIYGPGDTVLLPRILAAHRFGSLLAVGDGTNRVSLTHVDNLVDATMLATVALLRGDEGAVYNVADAEPVVLDEALRAVLRATGRRVSITYVPRALGWHLGHALELVFGALETSRAPRLTRYIVAQLASEYTLDLARARDALGYDPTRTLYAFLESFGETRTSSDA